MEALDELAQSLKDADDLLAETVLEPDPDRTDGFGLAARVRLVDKTVAAVVERADQVLSSTDDEDLAIAIRARVARMLGAMAALLHLAGDGAGFRRRLDCGAELALDGELREELEAGRGDVVWFCRLEHARWLREHEQLARADALFRRIAREAEAPPLRAAARTALDNRPLRSTPPLFRFNGCGVAMYGGRDHQADGWHVATHCLSLLFVPVLPLAAYWVREVDGGYQFRSRARMGRLARIWQLCFVVAALGGIGWFGLSRYRQTPDYQAGVALDEARAAEASGNRDGALERYTQVVRTYGASTDVTDAAEAVVRLASQGVTRPATPDSVDAIGRVVTAFFELPEQTRRGAPTSLLVKELSAWAEQIGDSSVAHAEASLAVLDSARRVAEQTPDEGRIQDRVRQVRGGLADRVAADQPLYALSHYVHAAVTAERLAAPMAIIDSLGESPSLWIEAETSISRWIAAAKSHPALNADARRIEERLAAARTGHAATARLVENADEKQLAKALAASPADQELAVALAMQQRERGESKAALATLTAIGPLGRMTTTAQQLLAACQGDLGDLAKADAVLATLVAQRLPAYQAAQREYGNAIQGIRERLMREIDQGKVPAELDSAMQAASESDRPGVFHSWIVQQIDADPKLLALKTDLERQVSVIPASLGLGTIRLRRANAATGEERRALLASAERVFLSIRQAAEGDPSFHLGLGQVFHRLGRVADGDAELERLVAKNEPVLMLQVSRVYRELGMVPRARQVAEAVYRARDAKDEERKAAALTLAHLALDLDEEQAWLEKSDASSPMVKDMLLEVQSRRHLRDGRYGEADRGFAKVAAYREREAKHDPTAANNAATALGARYAATGDAAHLKSSATLLDAAVRVVPDNALLLDNAAEIHWQIGVLRVLDGWIQTRQIVLEDGDEILGSLLEGPLRERVVEALQRDPSIRRARQLGEQEQVLAPQKQQAYRRQLLWLAWNRDESGLRELEKRLAAMPPFDSGDVADQRRKIEAGSKDEQHAKSIGQWVSRTQEMVKRAEKSGHGPTLAAALLRQGDAMATRTVFVRDDAELDAMIDCYRRAAVAWPEAGLARELPAALSLVAFLRTMQAMPTLRKAWDEQARRHDVLSIALQLASSPEGAGVLEAMRKRPELVEAVEIAKASPGSSPTKGHWLLARVAGDAELERAAAPVFDRADVLLAAKSYARLFPGEAREASHLGFLESRGAKLMAPQP